MTNFQRIEPPRLVEQLLPFCPAFKARWEEHLAYWGDQERGEFTDFVEFAHFLVDCYSRGRTETFPQVFAEIERLLLEGNAKVKELVSNGLLEDIQTIASNKDFGSGVFVQWLGPATRQAWSEIAEMWEDKQSLMDVVREERRQQDAK